MKKEPEQAQSAEEVDQSATRHVDHSKELPRLNRITGQFEGVKKMIEAGRYTPDILTQLRAVRAAILALEANLLETHLRACVLDAFQSTSAATKAEQISEIKEFYRRYDN